MAARDPFLDETMGVDGAAMGPGAGAVSFATVNVDRGERSLLRRVAGDRAITRAMFIGLVVLNLLDLVSTRLVLDRGGEESNPVMAPVVHNIVAAAGVKAACLALIWSLLLRSRCSPRMLAVVAAVNIWYVAVVGWNLKVLTQVI